MAGYKVRKTTNLIIVHCSATPEDMDIGVAEIRRWHRAKGWLDIGYHYVIRRNGLIEEGRPTDVYGAHARGVNHRSVGICMVGGVDADRKHKAVDNFADVQFDSLKILLWELAKEYPAARVIGHREVTSYKACPSFDVQQWLENLDEELQNS